MSKFTERRQSAYSDMVASKCFIKYREYFGNADTAKIIAKTMNAGCTTDANVDAIIKLFSAIFRGKGFTEEESIKFLNANKRIFEMSYNQVLTVLAITETAGLSEEAVFEKLSFILRAHEPKKFYDSVRVCRRDDEQPSLERILELENEDRKIEFKYDKSRIDMYKGIYRSKVLKKLKEQQEIEGAILKRTEE